MADTYISDTQLAARYGVHRGTPWRWVKTIPAFPKPVILTPGVTRWKLSEVECWEEAQTARAAT